MSDLIFYGGLSMPLELAMADDLSRIQFHGRAQQAVARMKDDATRIKQREAQVAMLVKASKQVLSDVDDDGVAERGDMGVLALRKAVEQAQAREILDVVACARRVMTKAPPDTDASEWVALRTALDALDNWPLPANLGKA